MKEFTLFTSTALPIRVDSIDTDQIIPARFLRAVERSGFGEKMFYDWRFNKDGSPKESIFSDPRYKGAEILVASSNFGVGSSREHAVWAIADYGFKAILAESFGDIFYNNSLKNGLLPIRLTKEDILGIHNLIEKDPALTITIDLPNQQVKLSEGGSFFFEIDAFRKSCLIKGVDEFGYLLNLDKEVEEFEMSHKSFLTKPKE